MNSDPSYPSINPHLDESLGISSTFYSSLSSSSISSLPNRKEVCYSPTSPEYFPTSPLYSKNSPEYHPSSPPCSTFEIGEDEEDEDEEEERDQNKDNMGIDLSNNFVTQKNVVQNISPFSMDQKNNENNMFNKKEEENENFTSYSINDNYSKTKTTFTVGLVSPTSQKRYLPPKCKFYLQNRCKFGQNCLFFHPLVMDKQSSLHSKNKIENNDLIGRQQYMKNVQQQQQQQQEPQQEQHQRKLFTSCKIEGCKAHARVDYCTECTVRLDLCENRPCKNLRTNDGLQPTLCEYCFQNEEKLGPNACISCSKPCLSFYKYCRTCFTSSKNRKCYGCSYIINGSLHRYCRKCYEKNKRIFHPY